ncbi:mechanosensitive ion channel [Maribacter confluentis]|uniref:Mechanosensitive ion channel n=1 Tax=Maribacter confluentis TaxID=1656093 RepID=A0ABT8RMB7_9FLAO|nr:MULTISPECIES: mechanosensitive ion channel domain-containing protein [Maribacter]MDO1511935.1 mechanosensitive ion channel [Maribacter confluentis]TVZ15201.1 putative transporter (transmembrane protein) [Maribacter sp. MAR_2009_72]
MDTVDKWKDLTFESLSNIFRDIAAALPGIFGAFIVMIFGWLIIKVTTFVLKRIFKAIKLDRFSQKINDAKLFGDADLKVDIAKLLVTFIKVLLWLVFIIVASDIMGLTIISSEIANLLRYLPILLSALVIFMIGLYLAKIIKETIIKVFDSIGMGGGKILGNVLFYLIIVFVSITALNQAGVDTEIVTNNFTIILGAFLLAIALALGLGSREVVGDLLRTFYTRKIYEVGDKVKIGKLQGTVIGIDNISMIIKTKTGKVVIPIKKVVEKTVTVDETKIE